MYGDDELGVTRSPFPEAVLSCFTFQKFHAITMDNHRRRKRGGAGGARPPNNLRGGGRQHTLWPPNNPPTFSFNFYVKQEKITNIPS